MDGPIRADQFHVSTSDPNGNFQFQGLAPGKYLIHIYLQGRMDTADFVLHAGFKTTASA